MRRSSEWTWSAIAFVVFAAVLGTLVSRYVNRLADRVEDFGYVANPEGTREFLRELDQPLFRQAGRECMDKAKPVDTFLWRFADEAHRAAYGTPFTAWNQGSAGTCVSFGWGMGSYIGQAVDWVHRGKPGKPPLVVATEPIYGGSRTAGRMPPVTNAGWSDGSYGGAAARWVSGRCKDPTVGGILYRQVYGDIDLSSYSIDRSRNWGCYGVPKPLAVEANKRKALAVAQVSTWDELVAAICSGYCVPICSDVGFASTNVRDADGFLPRGGSWSHCMVCVAIRLADGPGKKDGVLILNSWGLKWVTGPKWPSDQPDGSFWCNRPNIEAILRQGDSFAVGGVTFEYRDLEHKNWLQPAPAPTDAAKSPTVNHYLAL